MSEHLGLRRALRGLAAADEPVPVATGAVVGRALRIRRRRRTSAAVCGAVVLVAVAAGAARPRSDADGLVVAPGPSPSATSPEPSGSPAPSASVAPVSPSPGSPASPAPGGSAVPAGGGPPGPPPSPSLSSSPGPAGGGGGTPSPGPGSASPSSAPPPVCKIIVDPYGDVATPAEPSLDIQSADLATGDTTLVAVVRVGSLDAYPPQGGTWTFGWTLGGRAYLLSATRSATGTTGAGMTVDGVATGASVTYVFDVPSHEVRWVVPRADVPDLATATTFTGLRVTTSRGTGATASAADDTTRTATYEDRTPSCVQPD
jgi:hypothetical protein